MRLHNTLEIAHTLQWLEQSANGQAQTALDRAQEILAGTLLKLAEKARQ